MCYSFCFFIFVSLLVFPSFEILWVYLLQTLTRPSHPLRKTKWFKGLVAYTKCNRDSHESELDLQFSFLFLGLLEDEQKVGVGVFVRPSFDPVLALI